MSEFLVCLFLSSDNVYLIEFSWKLSEILYKAHAQLILVIIINKIITLKDMSPRVTQMLKNLPAILETGV